MQRHTMTEKVPAAPGVFQSRRSGFSLLPLKEKKKVEWQNLLRSHW